MTENNGAANDNAVGWSSNDADGYSAITAPCNDSSLTRCHGRCACMREHCELVLHAAVRVGGCRRVAGKQGCTHGDDQHTRASDRSHLQVGVRGPDQQPAVLWLLLGQLRLLHPGVRGQPVRLQDGFLALRDLRQQVPGC